MKPQADTKYCDCIWNEWRRSRNSFTATEVVPEHLPNIDADTLQYWMSRFVLEARKKDGNEYPPNTLHHIVESCDTSDKLVNQVWIYSNILHAVTSEEH